MNESDRALRVLIATESYLPSTNGVTNTMVHLLEHLRSHGHSATLLAPMDRGRATSSAVIDDDRVIRLPSVAAPLYEGLSVAMPSTRSVRRLIADANPDVVHVASPMVMGARVAAIATSIGLPVVSTFQTDLGGFARSYGLGAASPLVWSWLRRVHDRTDITLAPSTAAMRALQEQGIRRVGRWGRGVDREVFHPNRRSMRVRRQWLGNSPDDGSKLIIGYAGRLAKEKELERLAWLDPLPGVQLVLIGEGPERDVLQALLPRTHFTGFLAGEALASAVASLDVFVHLGRHETFCQAIQEAMACGVPVVAPAEGGPTDLVTHGETGYLFPVDEPALLLGYLRRLRDPDLRDRMGRTARRHTEGRDWTSVCAELLDIYGACIAARGTPRHRDHEAERRVGASVPTKTDTS